MTARDRYPEVRFYGLDQPGGLLHDILEALDRAEADADRLAEVGSHPPLCAWRRLGHACDCGWSEAKALHDEAVAQR